MRAGASGGAGAADIGSLLDLAVATAHAAGEVLTGGGSAQLRVSTKSTPTDVVTQMDTEAERLIARLIRDRRPDDAILGEEGQDTGAVGGRPVRWIVDPIDGTVNYLYGIPQWAVSIAVEVDGVVQAGVVFDAEKDETFTAIRGAGAYRNQVPSRVTGCAQLSQALVATGFGYAAARRAAQARVLTGVLPAVRDIRRFGAASLDLCALACGRVDGYYERGLNLWDFAAAGLIAGEAGARVSGLRGQPPSGELLVAGVPGVFDALRDLLTTLDADRD